MKLVPRPTLALLLLAFAAAAEEPSEAPATELRMDELVVTPGRLEQRRLDVAENVTVLTRGDVRTSPALAADDLLRGVPGFSLFRRSSSVVAHPTTQGVSLRGIGPSGASRTLVLYDGVPLNDPFGGWVYWSRIPLEDVERIEVVRGGGSGVWGNAALGGVIHVLGRRPEGRSFRLSTEGGNQETVRVDAAASEAVGPAVVSIGGGYFDTGGYPVVREDRRGPIDEDAALRTGRFRGRIDATTASGSAWGVHGSWFSESRDNGTPLTANSTEAGTIGASGSVSTTDGSEWRVHSFGQLQTFESTFSSQAVDRTSETPALDQFDVPSAAVGASLQWLRAFGAHRLTGGADFRWVDGETSEDFRFFDGRFTRRRQAGGTQRLFGLFGQDLWELPMRLSLNVALRGDLWRNERLFRRERSLEDGTTLVDDDFGDRDRLAFSPKIGLVHRTTERLSFRGAFYRGFRAPTLNELVRPFRVRNDITEANPGLDPERLYGGEIGAEYGVERLLARLSGFWNELEEPVANVTIGAGPGDVPPCGFVPEGGVCRQRQNLDRARIRGIEAEVAAVPAPFWEITASWLLSDAEVVEADAEPGLEGKRIAQVPRNEVVGGIVYDDPRILSARLRVRWVDEQFEDDQNELRLADFFVVDLFFGRELRPGVEAFLGIENLFDRTIPIGKTADGLVSIGQPFLVHGGIRVAY